MVHTPTIKQSNLESIVEKYDYFIFDCDGVLFHSHDEIGHAFKALRFLKQKNKQIYFFTNATTRTREELLHNKIIGEHKFNEIPLENLYTASYLTSLYVKNEVFPRARRQRPTVFKEAEPKVFVIGE